MQVPALSTESTPKTAAFVSPKPVSLSAHQIDKLASELSEKILFAGRMTLEGLVAKLGGVIRFRSFWDGRNSSQGSIEILALDNFSIYLADYTGRETNRFTIAHELGHYFLHYLHGSAAPRHPMAAARSGADETEVQANLFAFGLLMPRDRFENSFRELNGDVEQLAKRFEVTKSDTALRIDSLSLRL